MQISEVTAVGNRLLECLDVGVYLAVAALFGAAIALATLVVARRMQTDLGVFLLISGLTASVAIPCHFLLDSAHSRWRPVSQSSYQAALSAEEERTAKAFYRRYVSDGNTEPGGVVAGREVKVHVEVAGLFYFGNRSTATPTLVRVEATDLSGRVWVFFVKYQPSQRNPRTGDRLLIELKLDREHFETGWVKIDGLAYEK